MNENILASVLIFAYNHENYIEETIKSVLCQKCSFNFEIVVSDDSSTDDTLYIIKILQSQYPNLIRIISNNDNLGLNITFLNAVNSAKGKYIAPLGGDDYWIVNNKLEMQVQLLLKHSEVTYVHSEYKSFNESDKKITNHCNKGWHSPIMHITGKTALIEMLCHNWKSYPSASTCCFRKDPLIKGFQNHPEILSFNLSGEGTIIHTSMCYYGGVYAFIPMETAMYRIRNNSLSHFDTKTEQFENSKKYYLLRLIAAKSFGLTQDEIEIVQKKNMLELFYMSVRINTKNEFLIFLKTQSHYKENRLCFGPLLYQYGFNLFKYIYTIKLKINYTLSYILKTILPFRNEVRIE